LESGGIQKNIKLISEINGRSFSSQKDLENIQILARTGVMLQAASVLDFNLVEEKTAYQRHNRKDSYNIEYRYKDGMEKTAEASVSGVIKAYTEVKRANESAFKTYSSSMTATIILVIILLYFTLGAQFESFFMPLLVMTTIPLSLAGIGPVLLIMNLGLDSGSIMGMIVLCGVVVNNAILLYEAFIKYKSDSISKMEAAYNGAIERFRPVLTTTMSTVLALFPVCFNLNNPAQRAMAGALSGGLIASTLLTLFITPLCLGIGGKKSHA
jgi:multidrug efflux pump subunit AcrB